MVLLFLNELSSFVKIKTTSDMLVDTNSNSDKLTINIDIVLYKLPCSIISIDAQDIMGSHSLNVHGLITKTKLDKDGNSLGSFLEAKTGDKKKETDGKDGHNHPNPPNYEDVKKAILAEEGCRLEGTISVLRVPGNFHISTHAYGNIIAKLISEGIFATDLSHKINHISFGDETDIKNIKSKFDVGILNPIDGVEKIDHKNQKMYEYYLKVVPTTYIDINGEALSAHQFTSNSNENSSNMMISTIFFRYDISPILIRITQYKQPFFHFFIQICAIIGGMFTVMGIIDHMLYKLTRPKQN
jgi:Endoplasmic reticulum vesicle transporter/Endoplasmic Reticulum-Golgi Intermediate Compartment (ERGIC)